VLAGLDEVGKGCVYSYDPVGHCDRPAFTAKGSAGALLQPLLDNQIGYENMASIREPISVEKGVAIVKDAFISAAERDIYTGDSIIINIITNDGIREEKFALRRD
jgi:20S proteasome subunit beta 6